MQLYGNSVGKLFRDEEVLKKLDHLFDQRLAQVNLVGLCHGVVDKHDSGLVDCHCDFHGQ